MYDAIAIAFILVVAGLFWLAVKWARERGFIQQRGMLLLTIGVFSIIFVERLVQAIDEPFHQDAFDLVLLLGSLAIVIGYGVKLVRAR
jgi:hypothetical protein